MKKRWWIAGTAVVVLLGGGYAIKQYATAKIGDQVVQMIAEPDVKKAIDAAIANGNGNDLPIDLKKNTEPASETPKVVAASTTPVTQGASQPTAPVKQDKPVNSDESKSNPLNGNEASNTPSVTLTNREDAVAYAQSKFSVSEIANYLSLYKKKDQLSSDEKVSIKAEILSRFSASELKALQEAASK